MTGYARLIGGVALAAALVAPAAAADKQVKVLDWSVPAPTTWVAQQPSSNFRLAQFLVPGKARGAEGEVIVYYFGPGQGGPIQSNVERWVSQFSTADGKPVKPVMRKYTVQKMPVTTVELSGSYARSVGMQAPQPPKPNQMLLAAIVETPKGNVTYHLHGPRDTVQANKDAFWNMVRGMKGGA